MNQQMLGSRFVLSLIKEARHFCSTKSEKQKEVSNNKVFFLLVIDLQLVMITRLCM